MVAKGQKHNIRCFVAKSVLSRVTRTWEGGGSQKVTSDDEGEGGVRIPPKTDDVIYEQPLTYITQFNNYCFSVLQ